MRARTLRTSSPSKRSRAIPEVVLADEDDRQLPERRQRHALEEPADVGGALAEEAQRHPLLAQVLGLERRARRDRHVPADDAVAAQEVEAGVEEVHRPAEALRAARLLAVELGHDRARAHPLGVGVAVLAVRGDHVVLGAQRRDRADAHPLLPDPEVQEPADLALRVRLRRRLLQAPDRQHLPVQLEEQALVGRDLPLARLDPLHDPVHGGGLYRFSSGFRGRPAGAPSGAMRMGARRSAPARAAA
jgi:hypothetical protein